MARNPFSRLRRGPAQQPVEPPLEPTPPPPASDPSVADWIGRDLTYRSPLRLPSVNLTQLSTSSADCVWIERPQEPYPAGYYPPAFHDRATTDGLADLESEMTFDRPACFLQKRHDVLLTGYRTIVDRHGHYGFDEVARSPDEERRMTTSLAAPEQHLNEVTGFAATARPAVYQLVEPHPLVTIDEPVIFIGGNESPNWGSYIYRILPKVAQLARLDAGLKVLAPMQFKSMRELLVAAGISARRLIPHWIDHWYRLAQVYIPGVRNPDVWFDSDTIALFDSMRLRHGSPQSARRIYVTRRLLNGHPRGMVNEPELIATLAADGFDVVSPETMSAVEQIKAFSSAGTIVAAAGSAIYNAVFCYPGTRFIDIESEPHWIRGHVRIFSSRGLEYGVFEGRPVNATDTPHQPFSVDVSRLMQRLRVSGYAL